jgi:hypothetical protein
MTRLTRTVHFGHACRGDPATALRYAVLEPQYPGRAQDPRCLLHDEEPGWVWMCVRKWMDEGCMYVCMSVGLYVSMYVCMYVCTIYVCMYGCMYVCMYV